jgi:NAD-dependent deacetylase
MERDKLEKLADLIERSNYITALTGAGVSTLSGIPDFRGEKNPIWDRYPQEKVFDITYFENDPSLFYGFLREIIEEEHLPNVAHNFFKKMEEAGKIKAVITQNIDGLHQLAGTKKVYELHGSIYRSYCSKCKKEVGYNEFIKKVMEEKVPKCSCLGVIRPAVVFYGEELPQEDFRTAVVHASKSDLMIVAGTSLVVQPAAYMPVYTLNNRGKIALINRGETYIDSRAELVLDDLREAFEFLGEYFET